ncbi:MAG: DUF523 domain-containing protein [Desulfobacteraceae bacterium]|nr:DUF523 domain-containing protein [Desulfobacteraceae bacterium]
MAKILISSCLLGFKVRYNGSDMPVSDKNFEKLCSENQIIPFCPEVSAGLEIPRLPAEIQGGDGTDVLSGDARVLCNNGFDVTDSFLAGAKKALEICIRESIFFAVLTESSPSCGSKLIYDGSFSGIKKNGKGVTAALLENYGIKVFSQNEIPEIFEFLNR